MRQPLVPVLLLATVALSASNVLRLSGNDLEYDHQSNDNIFRNRFDTRYMFYRLFCKEIGPLQHDEICRFYQEFADNGNTAVRNYDDKGVDKDDNYNGEGYRKEQWHNYPRQLDRLQPYPFERHKVNYDKRVLEPDDPENTEEFVPEDLNSNEITANEYLVASNGDANHLYDAIVASTNPLLILKIRLACFNSERDNRNGTRNSDMSQYGNEVNSDSFDDEDESLAYKSPEPEVLKYKRVSSSRVQESQTWDDVTQSDTAERLPIKKRLFSLWSRLQSLSHKGHELHHRRHLAAYYGLPDELRGDTGLTAETRAALMRPPGSPLRWG